MTQIRTAIVGFGLSGQIFHEPALAANPAFEIRAVVTSSHERSTLARARGHDVVASLDALLDGSRELDLVVVATPPAAHIDSVSVALSHGLDVVTDKPFATSVRACETMIDMAKSAGRRLFVYQNRRWDGDFLTLRKVLADGALGSVFRFESSMEKFSGARLRAPWQEGMGRAEGGGVIFDLGSHLVDQALQLFGPARLMSAHESHVFPGRSSEDDAALTLLHASGVRTHLSMSRSARAGAARFRVLGTEGAFVVAEADGQEDYIKAGGAVTDSAYGVTPERDWGVLTTSGGTRSVPTERGAYPDFYRGVAEAIVNGTPGPTDPVESLEAIRIIDAAHDLISQAAK